MSNVRESRLDPRGRGIQNTPPIAHQHVPSQTNTSVNLGAKTQGLQNPQVEANCMVGGTIFPIMERRCAGTLRS